MVKFLLLVSMIQTDQNLVCYNLLNILESAKGLICFDCLHAVNPLIHEILPVSAFNLCQRKEDFVPYLPQILGYQNFYHTCPKL